MPGKAHAGKAIANVPDDGDESATMTKRLAMTPAVGLFAGLSVVSYGAVNMMLTGVHGTRQANTNACVTSAPASPAPKTTAAGTLPKTRTASHVNGRAQHPAGMPNCWR